MSTPELLARLTATVSLEDHTIHDLVAALDLAEGELHYAADQLRDDAELARAADDQDRWSELTVHADDCGTAAVLLHDWAYDLQALVDRPPELR
jgi:hypothetical protein